MMMKEKNDSDKFSLSQTTFSIISHQISYLEGGFENDDFARGLNPRLTVNLNRQFGIHPNFDMTSLKNNVLTVLLFIRSVCKAYLHYTNG